MDNDLKYLLNLIKENTGIRVNVHLPAGNELKPEDMGIKTDGEKTFFGFVFKSSEYVGELEGNDDAARAYAYLIKEFINGKNVADLDLGMNEYLKKIVLGECDTAQTENFKMKFNVKDVACYVLAIVCPKGNGEEVMNLLESFSGNTLDTPLAVDETNFAFVKFTERTDSEYQPASEFAEYLVQSIFEELGLRVSVGVGSEVKKIGELNKSYSQALAALKMSTIFNAKGVVHTYREFVLINMLEQLPKNKLEEYLELLMGNGGEGVFDDPEMVNTAEEFFQNSLNVSETSRELFMHRNTLMYRLDKIERASGLDIKNFSDAVTFSLIIMIKKLLEK